MKLAMIGFGQAGGKIVDKFIEYDQRTGSGIAQSAIAVNTAKADLMGLQHVPEDNRVLIGQARVKGHGVGADNELGAEIAEEDIDEVMEGIAEGVKVAYGPEQVKKAAEYGAIEQLLVLDSQLRKERAGDGDWEIDVDYVIETTEQKGGDVTVFSGEFDPGRQLANLGGIAALLRYRLE